MIAQSPGPAGVVPGILLACLVLVTGCGSEKSAPGDGKAADPGLTNRIDVPESVRQNLGITFAKVERRAVAKTVRVPGHYEFQPGGRLEYPVPLAGRIEYEISEGQPVSTGTVLYRVASQEWRQMQLALADAEVSVWQTSAALALARQHLSFSSMTLAMETRRLAADDKVDASVLQEFQVASARLALLERTNKQLGGQLPELLASRKAVVESQTAVGKMEEDRVELEQAFLLLRTSAEGPFASRPTLIAQVEAKEKEFAGAVREVALLRAQMTDLSGPDAADGLAMLEVRATRAGVLDRIHGAPGTHLEAGAPVMTVVTADQIQFRGQLKQADLWQVGNVDRAWLVAPAAAGRSDALAAIEGAMRMSADGQADQRTVEMIIVPGLSGSNIARPWWMRAGVAASAEVRNADGKEEDLAIPNGAIIQDDLEKVIFLRDSDNPDQVVRLEADIGMTDGRWTVVHSGVGEGDEVVLDGVYELKLTGGGKVPQGGHFHADGAWHPGKD